MSYNVQIGFKTDLQKRMKFKHRVEIGGSGMQNVFNDFIDMYLENDLNPDDVKKLKVNNERES